MAGIFYHILLKDPLVAVVNQGEQLPRAIERTVALADGAIAHLFVSMTWDGAVADVLEGLAKVVTAAASNHPNLRFTIMNPTAEENALYSRHGLDSIFCNHNAFLDGRIFTPDVAAEKKYDAVYTARMVPFKRHELAAEVPRMAVISNPYDHNDEYANACVSGYRDLHFVNYKTGEGVTSLKPEEVRAILTQSRCGLALSAVEGAMWASTEYLLAGLPVVSTPSSGGRDEFFHPDYVEIVEETPEAVAAGVEHIIARNLDPNMIRQRTQQLFLPHRWRLLARLSGLAQSDLFRHAGANLWLPSFVNRLKTWVTLD